MSNAIIKTSFPPDAFCNDCSWLDGSKYTCSKRAEFLVSRYKMTENQAIRSLFDQGTCIDPSHVVKDVIVKEEDNLSYNISVSQEHIGSTDKVATALESAENNINNNMLTVADEAKTAYSSVDVILQCILAILIVLTMILLMRKRTGSNNSLKKKKTMRTSNNSLKKKKIMRTFKVCILPP